MDQSYLNKQMFARAKEWGKLLNQYSIIEENLENGFNVILHTEDEPSEIESSNCDDKSIDLEAEAEGKSVSLLNYSALEIRALSESLLHKRCIGRKEDFTTNHRRRKLEDIDEGTDDDQLELLNETIPLIAECERKWEESGMFDVMNTFDVQKIEEKVGTWLRNNSVKELMATNKDSISTFPKAFLYNSSSYGVAAVGASEDESLHSIDTMRYVLSNRKPRTGSANNTMAIKNYRTMQSRRDALREKYSIPEDDSNHNLVPEKYRQKRDNNIISPARILPFRWKFKATPIVEELQWRPRRQLSKRRERTYSGPSRSSSSSDDENHKRNNYYMSTGRVQCKQRKRHMDRYYKETPSRRQEFEMVMVTPSDTRKPVGNRLSSQNMKLRPWKRESECCCNSNRLCKNSWHTADTSTEEWFVENNMNSDECHLEISNYTKAAPMKNTKGESKSTMTKKRKSSKRNERRKEKQEQQTSIATLNANAMDNSRFDAAHLQEAIKRSLQTAKAEEKSKHAQKHKSKKLTRRRETKATEENNMESTNMMDSPFEKVASIHKNVDNLPGCESFSSPDSVFMRQLKPQPKSAKIKKMNKLRNESGRHGTSLNFEYTSFASSVANVCNSTVIPRPHKGSLKQLEAIPSTLAEQTANEEVGNTVVSSTTGHNRDILLYSPSRRADLPEGSLSNGMFVITEDHLATFIGKQAAKKFYRHYPGKREYGASLNVYYRLPKKGINMEETLSDRDEIELLDLYGRLYAKKCTEN